MKNKIENQISFILIFIAILGVGVYFRIKGILIQSFWNDELYSIFASNPVHSLKKILLLQTKDAHPPLYQILLWLNFKIFGYSEIAARGFSAFFGILGIVSTYFLLKRLFDKYTAVLGTAISSTTVILIWYSQETRSYSLLYFLTVLTSILFLNLIEKNTLKNFCLYSFSAIAIVYTHYFGFFILLGHGISATILFLLNPRKQKKFFIMMWFAGLIVGLAFLPWFPYFFNNRMISNTWIKKPTITFFTDYCYFYWKHILKTILILFVFGIIGAIAEKEKTTPQKGKNTAIVFISAMIFSLYLIPYLISIYKTSVLLPRTTISGIPFLIAFFCYPFAFWKRKKVVLFVSLFFLIISSYQIEKHKEIVNYIKKEQVREILSFINNSYISNKFRTKIYSYNAAYLNSYAKMLNLNKIKIKFPTINNFFSTYQKLYNNDYIIVVSIHNFKRTINPRIYKFIKENCVLERKIELKKAKTEVYKVSKNNLNEKLLNSNLIPCCVKNAVFSKDKVCCTPEGNLELNSLILTKGKYDILIKGKILKGNKINLNVSVNGKSFFNSEISKTFNLKIPLKLYAIKKIKILIKISPASIVLPRTLKIREGHWTGFLTKIKENLYSAKWTNQRTGKTITDTLFIETLKENNIRIFRKKTNGYYRGYYDKFLNIITGKRDWFKNGNFTISCIKQKPFCFHKSAVCFKEIKIISNKKKK